MNSRERNRRRVLTGDERVLWKAFTKEILPLRDGLPVAEPDGEASEPDVEPPRLKAPPLAQKIITRTEAPLAPLGRRMKQRVARGKEGIDGRLDLHGLTQSEAHAALLHFLRSASARESRLVLVITGKGSRGGGEGVLRRQVPQWLGLPEFRTHVIGFETAHVAHGGEGALYVRIRRVRNR
jgi:DNA-nicking Smr family endonuclease